MREANKQKGAPQISCARKTIGAIVTITFSYFNFKRLAPRFQSRSKLKIMKLTPWKKAHHYSCHETICRKDTEKPHSH